MNKEKEIIKDMLRDYFAEYVLMVGDGSFPKEYISRRVDTINNISNALIDNNIFTTTEVLKIYNSGRLKAYDIEDKELDEAINNIID